MPARKTPEYYREYRQRRKAAQNPVSSGSNRASKFERAQFIAWDGEGFNTDTEIDEFTHEHKFVLFANSLGKHIAISAEQTYLSTVDCCELLLETAREHPRAIHVVYGGSYDMNHILKDLPKESVEQLARFGDCTWNGYYIRFLPRKSLFIQKGENSVTLWDVIGFFQMSFVQAITQWLGKDYADLPLIAKGKSNRTEFNDADMPFMIRYNDAELRALVLLMESFHYAVKSLGLKLARWDGAGAVAAAIYAQKDFKKHLGKQPAAVEDAARYAYFGGRFELGQYGAQERNVYGYDINSAYPAVFRDMPSLASGLWRKISVPVPSDISDFSLVRIRWSLPGIRFGPFPYRDIQGLVLFPETGENWVWGVELNAYLNTIPDRPDWTVELLECWRFESSSDAKPFHWVQEYYDERQRIVAGQSELPYGCQMVIKLGLNSLYGKTAQSLGWTEEKPNVPPYHNLCYAGFITAATRAKLWRAAMHAPDHIVMLATDGILSTCELPVEVAQEKVLGLWERTDYNYVMAIQSGVYILRKGEQYIFRKRGIDTQGNIADFVQQVLKHWGNRKEIYKKMRVPQMRLIGLKSAAVSDKFFRRWGCWFSSPHDLLMQPGPQTKRIADPASKNRRPGKGLVHTVPTQNVLYDYSGLASTPYYRPWDNDTERDNWQWDDPEEIKEILDYADTI